MRNLIVPIKQLLSFFSVIVMIVLLQGLVALIIDNNTVKVEAANCALQSLDAPNGILVAKFKCDGGEGQTANGKFIADFLKNRSAPVSCQIYGGLSDAVCEITKN